MRQTRNQARRPRFPLGVILGLSLICLGVALILHNLNLIYIEDVLQFWPCILIVCGIARLWNKGLFSIWGHILLVGGVLLQVAQMDYYRGCYLWWPTLGRWWPILVIWIGILVVAKAFIPRKEQEAEAQTPHVHVVSGDEDQWHHRDDVDAEVMSVTHEKDEGENE